MLLKRPPRKRVSSGLSCRSSSSRPRSESSSNLGGMNNASQSTRQVAISTKDNNSFIPTQSNKKRAS
uniref:Uncharacterized protein n=1 Tax=Panagrellus redivivus TaxID=6233 RepID=A0A7E4ZSR8_PANRE